MANYILIKYDLSVPAPLCPLMTRTLVSEAEWNLCARVSRYDPRCSAQDKVKVTVDLTCLTWPPTPSYFPFYPTPVLGHLHGGTDIWWSRRGLTVVGTQGPCRDAVGPHANGMVGAGSIYHSCLPGLFQQLSQRPGERKESRDLHFGVQEESHIHQIEKAILKRTQKGLKELLRHY